MTTPTSVLFQSSLVWFGTFRCPTWYPEFRGEGQIRNGHLVVFPRTGVFITHAGREPVLADPNVVMFYNQGQVYSRHKLSERGDFCEWFAFAPEVIAQALRSYDPAAAERREAPFAFTHAPSDARSYVVQRAVVEHVTSSAAPDRMFVEETMLAVLVQIVERAFQRWPGRGQLSAAASSTATQRTHAALAQEVRVILASRYQEPLSLEQIAAAVHTSPYHLCRVFRRQSGQTIYAYLDQLRLRSSLELVMQVQSSLADVACELGYASHSHFTAAFRRRFGLTPTALRQLDSARHVRHLRKILTA